MNDTISNMMTYEPDIRDLSQRLHLGPQGEILELLERFNDKYIAKRPNHYHTLAPMETKKLGVTKKFYWKPGAYDTIKTIINSSQYFTMKAQSMQKIMDRVRTQSTWRIRNLDTDISEIENKISTLRANGVVMQDNTDDAVEAYELIKNHFIEQYENSNRLFSINVSERSLDNEVQDYYIYVTYLYNNPTIEYKHAEGGKIGEVEYLGAVKVQVRYSVARLINILINNKMDITKLTTSNVKNTRDFPRGAYTIGGDTISEYNFPHPYISRPQAYYNRGNNNMNDFRYVCLGNMASEVDACFGSLDFISAKIFIDRLITHYDTNTGPLNRLQFSYHGLPFNIIHNDEWRNIIADRTSADCGYYDTLRNMPQQLIEEDSYCVKHCEFKNHCNAYKEFSKEVSQEELERIALETATINAARRI